MLTKTSASFGAARPSSEANETRSPRNTTSFSSSPVSSPARMEDMSAVIFGISTSLASPSEIP